MTEYVRLGDVCDISAGQGAPQGDDMYCKVGGKPFIKAGNLEWLSSGGALDAIQHVSDEVVKSHKLHLYPKGSIVFAKSGMSCKKSFVYILDKDCYIVSHLACLTPKKIRSDFLKYYLQAHPPSELIKNESYPSIKLSDISEIQLPLPSLEEQKRIAAALDKMSSVIAKRKRQIALLDEAAKSLFVEMFGDPVENPMGWDTVTVVDVCESIVGGGTPSKSHDEYYKGDIPWVTPKDMKSIIISDSKDHITEEAIQNSTTKLVPKDTVLMVVRSGILKHTLPVAITSRDVTLNQDMKAYITNEKTSPLYLLYFFKTMERKLLHKVKGTTADNLDFGMLKKLPYPLPPLDLQNLFAARIEALEAQRASCERGLKQMETAFAAMMQEYFE